MVDLRSDTVTRPTRAMKEAMFAAALGDDVFGDDPTVVALEARAAALAGKEAALFTASGTMANQIAIRLHTEPGDEVLTEAGAHPFLFEAGGAAAISGAQIRTVAGERGLLRPEDVAAVLRPEDVHFAPTRLLCVEDTSNRGGGTVYPLERLDGLCDLAHSRGIRAHLDGARAFNAVIASGVPLARRARGFDTVQLCLSKGLGCPVGSMLCGPRDLIAKARRVRKMLGGGMRQVGLLAAAGLYALEHHVDRLADDHRRARALAEGLRAAGYTVDEPETNLVYAELEGAPEVQRALESRGVLVHATGPRRVRLVTHLDVDDAGIDEAIRAFAALRR